MKQNSLTGRSLALSLYSRRARFGRVLPSIPSPTVTVPPVVPPIELPSDTCEPRSFFPPTCTWLWAVICSEIAFVFSFSVSSRSFSPFIFWLYSTMMGRFGSASVSWAFSRCFSGFTPFSGSSPSCCFFVAPSSRFPLLAGFTSVVVSTAADETVVPSPSDDGALSSRIVRTIFAPIFLPVGWVLGLRFLIRTLDDHLRPNVVIELGDRSNQRFRPANVQDGRLAALLPLADAVVEAQQVREAGRIAQYAFGRMARAFQLHHLRDQLVGNVEKLFLFRPPVGSTSSSSPRHPSAIGYFFRWPISYSSHSSCCCRSATSRQALVAVSDGLIADTIAATSMYRLHTTGWPATYSHVCDSMPGATDCPRLSSAPLPCHVTSIVSSPVLPNTTHT
uniref:Uncharacterized protein n=1 Tax=Anopheles merus TaxID=30066 RepID=A0A182VP99_ANOME